MERMSFTASVRGFDAPAEVLDRAESDAMFRVIREKNYFYYSEDFRTEDHDKIVSTVNAAVDIVEEYPEIFQKTVRLGGEIELYITYHTNTTAGFEINTKTIDRLSSLGISLAIDFM